MEYLRYMDYLRHRRLMKISVNDKELFTLTDTQKKVICDYMSSDIMEEDLKRRLKWIILHLYEQAFNQLKNKWEPKLAERVGAVPTNREALAELIFEQPDYEDRKQREVGER